MCFIRFNTKVIWLSGDFIKICENRNVHIILQRHTLIAPDLSMWILLKTKLSGKALNSHNFYILFHQSNLNNHKYISSLDDKVLAAISIHSYGKEIYYPQVNIHSFLREEIYYSQVNIHSFLREEIYYPQVNIHLFLREGDILFTG